MLIKPERVIQWMNVIRQTEGDTQHRILENFWGSQLSSKSWMIDVMKSKLKLTSGTAYIMGGWYGVSAQFIRDNYSEINIVSIDVDPQAELFGTLLSKTKDILDEKITFKTANMESFTDYNDSVIIINTSTEHLTQECFEEWKNNLPDNVPIILQGNNLFNCDDHIRCSTDLKNFNDMNPLSKILFTDYLLCDTFYRFMTIGYK